MTINRFLFIIHSDWMSLLVVWTVLACVSNAAFLQEKDRCPKSYYQFVIKSDSLVTCCPCQSCENEIPTKTLAKLNKCIADDPTKRCIQYEKVPGCYKITVDCDLLSNKKKKRNRCRRKKSPCKKTPALTTSNGMEISMLNSTALAPTSTLEKSFKSSTTHFKLFQFNSTITLNRYESTVPTHASDELLISTPTNQTIATESVEIVQTTDHTGTSVGSVVLYVGIVSFVIIVICMIFFYCFCLRNNKEKNNSVMRKTNANSRQNSYATTSFSSEEQDIVEHVGGHTEKENLLSQSSHTPTFKSKVEAQVLVEEPKDIDNNTPPFRPQTLGGGERATQSVPQQAPPGHTFNIGGNYNNYANASNITVINNHYPPPVNQEMYRDGTRADPLSTHHQPAPTSFNNGNSNIGNSYVAESSNPTSSTTRTQESMSENISQPSEVGASVRNIPTYPIRQHTRDEIATNQSHHRSSYQSEMSRMYSNNENSFNVCYPESSEPNS